MQVHVQVKNVLTGEVYFEMDFNQNMGMDFGMGSNIGTTYLPSNQIHHIQLELSGEVVVCEPVQLELSL